MVAIPTICKVAIPTISKVAIPTISKVAIQYSNNINANIFKLENVDDTWSDKGIVKNSNSVLWLDNFQYLNKLVVESSFK